MTSIYDLPPILKGIWMVEFYDRGRKVFGLLNAHERIQRKEQAVSIASYQLRKFNPKLEWDDVKVTFTSELSL